ncbi:histidinol-phosphate transaminase [Glaciecola sp. XM2]|uniref:histidinol-phosphate transaminase n=1 Tax=Glaciecola sp. XM2 TaxID=1914931 RepID=UPI001BDDE503|nr:histidinol-phosphate transaminase [Glaciecola sp. XM2]MBT1449896.1 histidinol-phosphate transaminase [Glaciecola sp. XM2]
MSKWLENITNDHVLALTPYESARRLFSSEQNQSAGQVWLNANEAPSAQDYQIDSTLFNRYPDCQPLEVIGAYAKYSGLSKQQIVATRGADEGIELVIRAFCEPGKSSVLVCPPTYGMYAISAQTFNVGVERAPLNQDFSLDLATIETYVGKVNVVFLCSPNNPTGTRLAQADIIAVLNMYKDKALVVLDEAYVEFDSDAEQTQLLQQYDNLLILRTLSKAFALAGIRCGFALSSAEICTTLLKVIAPYPVPAPVAQVASVALSENGVIVMRERVASLQTGIERIKSELANIPNITLVGDAKANFVLFKSDENPQLMRFLVENGVIIRDQSKQLNLQNCLRITVGSDAENTKLLSLIQRFFDQAAVRNAS